MILSAHHQSLLFASLLFAAPRFRVVFRDLFFYDLMLCQRRGPTFPFLPSSGVTLFRSSGLRTSFPPFELPSVLRQTKLACLSADFSPVLLRSRPLRRAFYFVPLLFFFGSLYLYSRKPKACPIRTFCVNACRLFDSWNVDGKFCQMSPQDTPHCPHLLPRLFNHRYSALRFPSNIPNTRISGKGPRPS